MFDFLGGLIGAGSRLLGGILGNNASRSNIAAQEQAQMAEQRAAPLETALGATDAQNQTGINRLALLGINPASGPSIPVNNAMGDAVSGIGQDISRSLTAYADKNDKAAQLNQELIQAKINNVNATTAGQQLENSKLARTFASPGSPPGLARRPRPDGSEANPYPAYAYYDMGGGRKIRLLSHEAASTQFGPTSIVTGAELLPGMVIHQLGDTAGAVNSAVRPDVARSLNAGAIGNPAGDFGFSQ